MLERFLQTRWGGGGVSERDDAAGSVTVEQNTTKGGENGQRRVSLDDQTIEEITAHRKRQLVERLAVGSVWMDLDYIFVQEDGTPIYASTPRAIFKKVSRRLGLKDMNLHGLRHLHATELLRIGKPLHGVAQRLGHRDAMVTATIYAHVIDQQSESAANDFAIAAKQGA